MHRSSSHSARFEHDHRFLGADHSANARKTLLVVVITALAMAAEIAAGLAFGSMALLADGFHMATHAGAIGIAALAYQVAARRSRDPRLAMGAGKIGDLAGFGNAVVLGVVSLVIAWESLDRLFAPQPVAYREATVVAVLGLVVNLICAWLLAGGGGHGHHHDDGPGHRHGHGAHHGHGDHDADHNLRGAYLHVLADALTSVAAIGGLAAGWAFGWRWVDPAVGVLGSVMIASWSISLGRSTAMTLIDAPPDTRLETAIRERLEVGDVVVCDLHVWRIGPGHVAAIVSLVTHDPKDPASYKAKLTGIEGLSHLTIEVNRCPGERCAA